jgi:hypothetical protein
VIITQAPVYGFGRIVGTRHQGLGEFAFDPATDIAIGAGGCWEWATAKPELHRYLRDYFAARREDGVPEAAAPPALPA